MVTKYGMSSDFDMVTFTSSSNQYLGGQDQMTGSAETAAKIDRKIVDIVKECHATSVQILSENIDKLHEISAFLLDKETISGVEFMEILNRPALIEITESDEGVVEELPAASSI